MPPHISVEVWEGIIDHLWDRPKTLRACACVCKDWRPRSQHLLVARSCIDDRSQVLDLVKLIRTGSSLRDKVTQVVVRGGEDWPERKSIPHLGTFAAMLAGRLPQIKVLGIWSAVWEPGSLHPDIALHLSAFTSITWLDIYDVTFPSITVFGRVVDSFPSLERLQCYNASFTVKSSTPRISLHPNQWKKVTNVELDGSSAHDVIGYMISIGVGSKLTAIRAQVGYYWEPSLAEDAQTFAMQRLLKVVGESLGRLDLTLASPAATATMTETGVSPWSGLDLTQNTKLEQIYLGFALERHKDFASIATLLSRVESRQLCKVTLVLDARYEQHTQSGFVDTALSVLDPSHCAAIDRTLTQPHHARLSRVI